MTSIIRSITTAFRTLTIIPLPGKDTDHFPRSLPFFAFVGLVLSLVPYGIYRLALSISFDKWTIAALMSLTLVSWLTGGLHLDGLADAFDGFGGGKTRERILEIFKDSRIGTFGVLALVFDLLIKLACWVVFLQSNRAVIIVWSLVLSRAAQSFFIALFPNARPVGGIANAFTKPGNSVIIWTIVILGSLFLIFSGLTNPQVIMISTLAAFAILVVFGRYCVKKINGITGDCVGALNEFLEVAVLVSGLCIV